MGVKDYMDTISKENLVKWGEFVAHNLKGNMFQSPEMYNIYKESEGYEPIVVFEYREDEIVGVLLGVVLSDSRRLLKRFTSRMIVIGGPITEEMNIDVASKLIEKLDKIAKVKAIYLEYRNIFDVSCISKAFVDNGYKYEPHYDIHMDLNVNITDILERISSKNRTKIRRALKNDVELKVIDTYNDEVEKCYLLIQKLYNKLGLPLFDKQLLISSFNKNNDNFKTLAFCLYHQGKIIGTRIVYCYNDLIYDWYAASDEDYLKFRPNDILPYQVMVWGAENGYEIFDFGGAGKPGVPYGVRDYKLRFGGELIDLGRYKKIYKPILYKVIVRAFLIYKKLKQGK